MLAKLSVDQALTKARSHAKKGEVAEAQRLYQSVLQVFAKNQRAQQGLAALNKPKSNIVTQGMIQEAIDQLSGLYNQGEFTVVVERAQALTMQYPEAFIFWHVLGASSTKIGMLEQAITAYKKVISLKPDYVDAYTNMGVALQNQGKLEEAIDAHKKSISLKPDYAVAYSNMGNVLKDQGKLDEAIEAYNKAISIKPDYADTHNNLGNALQDQGKFEKALTAYNKAISCNPNYAEVYSNIGNIFKHQGKLNEAIESFSKALLLKPNYAVAHNNLGNALKDQGKVDEAIEAYRKALSFKPNYAEAHQNLSPALLNIGKIKEGFDEYEWRWKTDKFLSTQRHFSRPLWDGKESLHGKRILLWCEQGIGDTINWSSCLPLVTSRAKDCIVECQKKLVPLLQRSFPNVEIKAEDRSLDSEREDFDLHLPMGSLYKHFIEEIMQNAKPDAFLVPDPERVKFWKTRLRSLGKGPYIGISWKSSDMSPTRLPNYTPISEWSPVLKVPDVTFINLQYTDSADDIAKIKDEFGVTVHNFEDIDQYNDIDDVAALCAALNMVVSTKLAPPFISSAVGTSTKIANWRQSSYNNILTNPVTSSYEMFERDTREPWDNVFSLIAKEILELN